VRVLAFTRYDRLSASTRQRFLQFEAALASAGITVEYAPFFSDDHLRRLAEGRHLSVGATAKAYLRRFGWLWEMRNYDLLCLHSELFPYLPGFFERLIRLSGRPFVYDYDDAVFHWYDKVPSKLVRGALSRKLEPVLKAATACCCGNPYLRDYAARFCNQAIVLPTVVDTDVYRPIERNASKPPTIGWIGSPSTWPNVRQLLPLLSEYCASGRARFRAIGAGIEAETDQFEGMELVPWTEVTEVSEVQHFDIGIMPLIDAPFQRGKSGFKLVQYMACGIPAIASPVGVNRDILEGEGVGILASTSNEWRKAFDRLLADPNLRRRLGTVGRERAVRDYSLSSQAPRLIELFRFVSGQKR
jgi:glycosyltransferase involved in cell wall biosynthesis